MCGACGERFADLWDLEEHKYAAHPNVWCTHFDFEGPAAAGASALGAALAAARPAVRPAVRPAGAAAAAAAAAPALAAQEAASCTKCGRCAFAAPAELHRHMLECGGDATWMLTMLPAASPRHARSRKWRPFGSRRRRQQGRRGMKRNIPSTPPARLHHHAHHHRHHHRHHHHHRHRPRARPTDSDTIQRMIANLPPKRSTRRVIQFNEDDSKTHSQINIHSISVANGLSRLAQQRSRAAAERHASLSVPSSPGPHRDRAQALLARKRATPPASPSSGLLPDQQSELSSSAPVTPITRPTRPSSVPLPVTSAARNLKIELDLEDVALSERVTSLRLKLSSGLKALKRAKAAAVSKAYAKGVAATRVPSLRSSHTEAASVTSVKSEETVTETIVHSVVEKPNISSVPVLRGRATRRNTGTVVVRSSSQNVQGIGNTNKEIAKRSSSLDNRKSSKLSVQLPYSDTSEEPKKSALKVFKVTRTNISKRGKEAQKFCKTSGDNMSQDSNVIEELQDVQLNDNDDLISNASRETSSILAAMRLAMMESEKSILSTQVPSEVKQEDNSMTLKRTRSKTFSEIEDSSSKKICKKLKVSHLQAKNFSDNIDMNEQGLCGDCDTPLANISTLERHKKRCTKPDSQENSVDQKDALDKQLCQHCGKYFPYSPFFWKHLKSCSNIVSQFETESVHANVQESGVISDTGTRRQNKVAVPSVNEELAQKAVVVEQEIDSPAGSDFDDKMPELEKVEPIEVVKRITRSRKGEDLADIPILSPVISELACSVQDTPPKIEELPLSVLPETESTSKIIETSTDNRKNRRKQLKIGEMQEMSTVVNIKEELTNTIKLEVNCVRGGQRILGKTRKSLRQSRCSVSLVQPVEKNPISTSPKRKRRNLSRSHIDVDYCVSPSAEGEEQFKEEKIMEKSEEMLHMTVTTIDTEKNSEIMEPSSISVLKRSERKTRKKCMAEEEIKQPEKLNTSDASLNIMEQDVSVGECSDLRPLDCTSTEKRKKKIKKRRKRNDLLDTCSLELPRTECPLEITVVNVEMSEMTEMTVNQLEEELSVHQETNLPVLISEVHPEDSSSNFVHQLQTVEKIDEDSLKTIADSFNIPTTDTSAEIDIGQVAEDAIATEAIDGTENSTVPNVISESILCRAATAVVESALNKRKKSRSLKINEDATPLPPNTKCCDRNSHRSFRRHSLNSLHSDTGLNTCKKRKHSNHKNEIQSGTRSTGKADIKVNSEMFVNIDTKTEAHNQVVHEEMIIKDILVPNDEKSLDFINLPEINDSVMKVEPYVDIVLPGVVEEGQVQIEEQLCSEDYFEMDEESLPIAKLRDPDFMVLYHARKTTRLKIIPRDVTAITESVTERNIKIITTEDIIEQSLLDSASTTSTEITLSLVKEEICDQNKETVEETTKPMQIQLLKTQEEGSTPSLCRERSVRITRSNLSYEEMYTSSDVASETDSQEFDARMVKDLPDVPDPVQEKIQKQNQKRNCHLSVKRGKKSYLKRHKSLKLQLAKNKRQSTKRRRTASKKSPSDVKENAKIQNEISSDITELLDKVDSLVPSGVLVEQHQTTLVNTTISETIDSETAVIIKEEPVPSVKKRKRHGNAICKNPLSEKDKSSDILDKDMSIDDTTSLVSCESLESSVLLGQETEQQNTVSCAYISSAEDDGTFNETEIVPLTLDNASESSCGSKSSNILSIPAISRDDSVDTSTQSEKAGPICKRYRCSVCEKYFSTGYNLRKHTASSYHKMLLCKQKESTDTEEDIDEIYGEGELWKTVNSRISSHENVLRVERVPLTDELQAVHCKISKNSNLNFREDSYNSAVRKKPKIKRKQLEEAIKILQESPEHNNNGLGSYSQMSNCNYSIKVENIEEKFQPQYDEMPLNIALKCEDDSTPVQSPISGGETTVTKSEPDILGPSTWSQNSCIVYPEQSALSSSFSLSGNYEKHLLEGELEFSASSSQNTEDVNSTWAKHAQKEQTKQESFEPMKEIWTEMEDIQETCSSLTNEQNNSSFLSGAGDSTWATTQKAQTHTLSDAPMHVIETAEHRSKTVPDLLIVPDNIEIPEGLQEPKTDISPVIASMPVPEAVAPGWGETPAWPNEPPSARAETWPPEEGPWNWPQNVADLMPAEGPQPWNQEGASSFFGQLEGGASLGSIMDSVNQILDSRADGEAALPVAPAAFLCGGAADADGELRELQRAMGATDEEMAILQQLGETWAPPPAPAAAAARPAPPLPAPRPPSPLPPPPPPPPADDEPEDIIDLDRQPAPPPPPPPPPPLDVKPPPGLALAPRAGSEERAAAPAPAPAPAPGPARPPVKERAAPLIIRPAPLTPAKKKKMILQTLMARRAGAWGSRESPEYRAIQDQSLLFEYQDKEMVCPLCHRFFLGLKPLQAHIASNHNQEQVGTVSKQPRPRKSLASLLSTAPPGACSGGPRLLCSLCRELLPDEASLARHVKDAHSASSSSAPAAREALHASDTTSSADPGAAGLRIQMSNALGSLFDRALSNVLGKGRRPGVVPDGMSLNQLSLLQMTLKRGFGNSPDASSSATPDATPGATPGVTAATAATAAAAAGATRDTAPGGSTPPSPPTVADGDAAPSPATAPAPRRVGRPPRRSSAPAPDASCGPAPAAGGAEPDRPFACPGCDDRFFTLSTRNRHIARAHDGAPALSPSPSPNPSPSPSLALAPALRPPRGRGRSGSAPAAPDARRAARGARPRRPPPSPPPPPALPPSPPPPPPPPPPSPPPDDDYGGGEGSDDLDGWRDPTPTDWCVDPAECEDGAGSFLCSDCGINFESPQEVLRHRRLEHPSQGTTSNVSTEQDYKRGYMHCQENTGSDKDDTSPLPLLTLKDGLPLRKIELSDSFPKTSHCIDDKKTNVSFHSSSQLQKSWTTRDHNLSLNYTSCVKEADTSVSKANVSLSSRNDGSSEIVGKDTLLGKKQHKSSSSRKKDKIPRRLVHSSAADDEDNPDNAIRARAEAALRELNRQKARSSSVSGSKWGLTFTVTESPEKQCSDSEGSADRKGSTVVSNRFNLPLVRKLPLGVGRFTSLAEKKKKSSVHSVPKKLVLEEGAENEATSSLLEKTSLDVYEFEEDELDHTIDLAFRTSQQQSEEALKNKNIEEEICPFRKAVNGESENSDVEESVSACGVAKISFSHKNVRKKVLEIESCSTESSMSALFSEDSFPATAGRKDHEAQETSTSVSDVESTSDNSKESIPNVSSHHRTRPKMKRNDVYNKDNGNETTIKKTKYRSESTGTTTDSDSWMAQQKIYAQDSLTEGTSDEICDESDEFVSGRVKESISSEISRRQSFSHKHDVSASESEGRKRHRSESESRPHSVSRYENPPDRSSSAASRRRRAKSDLLISIFAKPKRNFMTNSIISRSKSFVNIVPRSEDFSSDDSEQNCVVSEENVSSQVL